MAVVLLDNIILEAVHCFEDNEIHHMEYDYFEVGAELTDWVDFRPKIPYCQDES